jgi:hypothetical protein
VFATARAVGHDVGEPVLEARPTGRLAPDTGRFAGQTTGRRGFVGRTGLPDLVDDALEVQAGDGRERLEVAHLCVVDGLERRSVPVEETQQGVDLVWEFCEALGELGVVDLIDRVDRGELLLQAPPLVHATHALHQEALGRRLNAPRPFDRLEVDLEVAVFPGQEPVDGVLAPQFPGLRVDDLTIGKVEPRLMGRPVDREHAALAPEFNRLQQVDHAHVFERAEEPAFVLALELGSLALLQGDGHPGDDLFDVDRLGEVVVGAEFEAADFVLDGRLIREEDERNLPIPFVGLHPPTEFVPVHHRHVGVGEDERGADEIEFPERLLTVGRRRHAVTGIAQRDLHHAEALRVVVDQEQVLFHHRPGTVVPPCVNVKLAIRGRTGIDPGAVPFISSSARAAVRTPSPASAPARGPAASVPSRRCRGR